MENNIIPTAVRRLLIITVALLTVTILAAGANMYVTLAAPQRTVFVPTTVGFEGRLADSSGSPVADGNYSVTFSLYSQAEGGTALWDEQQTVTTHSGLYSVQLGVTEDLEPADFDGPRWLGVKLDSETAEMTPRIPISSVPFALNAQEAAHAEQADQADQAAHADTAAQATHADAADQATHADEADQATHADEADQAAQALGLQGRSVSASVPTDGQALIWDDTNSEWLPQTIEIPDNYEYPRRAFGFHTNDKVTGTTMITYFDAAQRFGHVDYQTGNGDTFTTSFTLQAGTYTLNVLGIGYSNRGKIDWYVDNVLQISGQDWYSPSVTYNVVKSSNITVAGDGYHVLKGVVNGRNASSTGYHSSLTQWWIEPAPMDVYAITAVAGPISDNYYRPTVTVTIQDNVGQPVAGVLVYGVRTTTELNVGSWSCTTDASGQCTYTLPLSISKYQGIEFKVLSLSHATLTYDETLYTPYPPNPVRVFLPAPG